MRQTCTSKVSREPSWFVRLIRFARSHGVRRALSRVARRLSESRWCRRWLQFVLAEVYHAPVSQLKRSRRVPGVFTVRPIEADDLPVVEAYFDNSRVHERFRRGDVCFVTFVKNEIGGGVWFSTGPNVYPDDWPTLRCAVSIPAGVAWTFDGKGTRMGAWGAMMMRLPEYLEGVGAEDVYTLIDYDNQKSINGHLSLGYRRGGMVVNLRVLGLGLTAYKADGHRWRLLPGRIGRLEFDGNPASCKKECETRIADLQG